MACGDDNLIDLLPAGVYTCAAPGGAITHYNARAVELWGREPGPGETEEQFWNRLGCRQPDGAGAPATSPVLEALLSGLPVREREVVLEPADGARTALLFNAEPLRDGAGGLIGAVGVFQEISALKRAQETLRQSEERFRFLAEGIPHMAWIARADGFVEYCNRRWLDYAGVTPGQMLGWHWQRLLHPDDLALTLDLWTEYLETGQPYVLQCRLRRVDGKFRWHVARGEPLRDEAGCVVYWFGTCTDVEDQHQAEQELWARARQQAVITELSQAALAGEALENLQDQTTRHVIANLHTEFCELLELRAEEQAMARAGAGWQEGEPSARVLPAGPGTLPGYALRARGPVVIEEFEVEDRFSVPDHLREAGVVSGLCVVIQGEGRSYGVLGTYSIRRRCFSPNDIRFVQAAANVLGLAFQRRRLDEALQQRAEELAETDRRKDEFLALLAHELRNPLAAISNAAYVLQQSGGENPREPRLRDTIARQTRHLSRLVDDLLEVSRITRGKIELRKEALDMAGVIRHAAEAIRPQVEARHLELTLLLPPEPLWVEADPTRLDQILSNVLGNAVKYTEPGGRIVLDAERETLEIVVRVRDTGRGIPRHLLRHIFDLFVQVQPGDRNLGGLGIGLTLVRNLVEMHGGSVSAYSSGPGRGSRFTIRLPRLLHEPQVRVPPAVSSPGEGTPSRKRILVIEDNVDGAETLEELLQLWGYEVRVAATGAEGLQAADEYLPDAILLDIGLPDMDGYEVARRLRAAVVSGQWSVVSGDPEPGTRNPEPSDAEPPTPGTHTPTHPHTHTPMQRLLIALTGYGQVEDQRRAREAGFDHHLTKPVNPEALRRLLS